MKVFGSDLIDKKYKLCFLRTLVLSKQHFNVHISVPTSKDIRKLNGTYMRGLRRIANELRYERSDDGKTDLEVRILLDAPSVDCILLTARLRYAARIVREAPASLVAALHFRRRGKQLPWTNFISHDMTQVARQTSNAPQSDPSLCPSEWAKWIVSADALHAIRRTHFCESIVDATKPARNEQAENVANFGCDTCGACFASSKALSMHGRTKHGLRSPWTSRVGSSVCPACGKDFHMRVRCLNHIGDTRRPRCAEWIMQHLSPLPQKQLDKLNIEDAAARKTAQRQGHTTCLTKRPPVQANRCNLTQSANADSCR